MNGRDNRKGEKNEFKSASQKGIEHEDTQMDEDTAKQHDDIEDDYLKHKGKYVDPGKLDDFGSDHIRFWSHEKDEETDTDDEETTEKEKPEDQENSSPNASTIQRRK